MYLNKKQSSEKNMHQNSQKKNPIEKFKVTKDFEVKQ